MSNQGRMTDEERASLRELAAGSWWRMAMESPEQHVARLAQGVDRLLDALEEEERASEGARALIARAAKHLLPPIIPDMADSGGKYDTMREIVKYSRRKDT